MAADKKPKSTETKPEKSFEQNLTELETIVSDLEKGELPLEESIQKYQDGIERLKQCHQILEQAQKKVDLLTRDARGALATKPLPGSEERAAGEEG